MLARFRLFLEGLAGLLVMIRIYVCSFIDVFITVSLTTLQSFCSCSPRILQAVDYGFTSFDKAFRTTFIGSPPRMVGNNHAVVL
jgi:hypothetical protein